MAKAFRLYRLVVNMRSEVRGGETLTFPVGLLHARVLLLQVRLQILQHLDLQVVRPLAVRQDVIVEVLHVRNEHEVGVHDEQETWRGTQKPNTVRASGIHKFNTISIALALTTTRGHSYFCRC